MEIHKPPLLESECVRSHRFLFILNQRNYVISMHSPGCEGIQTDREWAAWAIRWPNHCGTCMGSGIGSYSGGGEYEPPDMEPCEECILPHSDERSKCPRCAYLFPEDDMEVNKCAHCGWNAIETYPDSAPYGGEHGCSCQWADEGDEIMDQIGQELADILYRDAEYTFESEDFSLSPRHYMNDAESISDDELRKQGKILEQDSGSQYSPCACGCRILVRRPCLRCGSDQHSHKDRFSCAAMSDGSRRYRGQPQCFRCKAYGHTQKICPLPAPVFPPHTCAYCGEAGHNARWCPSIPDDFEWPTPEYLEWDAEGEMIHHPEHDAFIEELNKVFSNYVPASDGFIDYHNFTSSDGSVEIVIVESNDWWLQRDLEENEPPDTYMILEWLYSKDKNQGSAGKVMSEIINAADRTGVTLHLDCGEHWPALPGTKEKNAIPAKELAGWYETFGFTEGGPIKRMIRKPERADWNPIKVRWAESGDFEAPRNPLCLHGRERYYCKGCGGGGICEHGRRRSRCKECGGNQICEHGRDRYACKECGGGRFCEHGRQKYGCKECGGTGICEHGRLRAQCNECGGSAICDHGRQRASCKECGGSAICVHNRQRSQCKECGGSEICEHGRQRGQCRDCGGSQICEHGRGRHECRVCSGTGVHKCGHCGEIGHNRRTCPNLHESFHAAEGNDEEPPHTRAIAGVSDSVAKFANANDTDDWAYAFGGFVAGFVLLPLVGTLISGWLMSKLKKRNLIPWENDDAEQG